MSEQTSRPACPIHGTPMQSSGTRKGARRWRCAKGTHPAPTRSNPRPRPDRPDCPGCLRPMNVHGVEGGRQRWCCRRCRVTSVAPGQLRALDIPAHDPDELLDAITRMLPRYLSPEAREDARQSLALAVLEGVRLTARDVRREASRAVGIAQNRFKFLSLDAPTPGTERLTWADTLVG